MGEIIPDEPSKRSGTYAKWIFGLIASCILLFFLGIAIIRSSMNNASSFVAGFVGLGMLVILFIGTILLLITGTIIIYEKIRKREKSFSNTDINPKFYKFYKKLSYIISIIYLISVVIIFGFTKLEQPATDFFIVLILKVPAGIISALCLFPIVDTINKIRKRDSRFLASFYVMILLMLILTTFTIGNIILKANNIQETEEIIEQKMIKSASDAKNKKVDYFVENKDISGCISATENNITGLSLNEEYKGNPEIYCKARIANMHEDYTICEGNAACLTTYVENHKDPYACLKINEESTRNLCILFTARINGDPEICELVTGYYKERCIRHIKMVEILGCTDCDNNFETFSVKRAVECDKYFERIKNAVGTMDRQIAISESYIRYFKDDKWSNESYLIPDSDKPLEICRRRWSDTTNAVRRLCTHTYFPESISRFNNTEFKTYTENRSYDVFVCAHQ